MRGVTIGCGESLSDKQFCKITLGRARTTILIVTCKSLYTFVSLHPPTLDTTNGLNFIPSIHHYCPFLKWSNIEGALWCSKSWSESHVLRIQNCDSDRQDRDCNYILEPKQSKTNAYFDVKVK
jgi:hypothetical protein